VAFEKTPTITRIRQGGVLGGARMAVSSIASSQEPVINPSFFRANPCEFTNRDQPPSATMEMKLTLTYRHEIFVI
jgi:hypothetical protein